MSGLRGYRGIFRELGRTRSGGALWLQLRGGVLHVLRHLVRGWRPGAGPDGSAQFLRNYGPEGFAFPDAERRRHAAAAERCLVCGLCSAECARVGGAPPIDPQEAVVATSRLASEASRFGVSGAGASPCGSCRACHAVCPVSIPIADLIDAYR